MVIAKDNQEISKKERLGIVEMLISCTIIDIQIKGGSYFELKEAKKILIENQRQKKNFTDVELSKMNIDLDSRIKDLIVSDVDKINLIYSVCESIKKELNEKLHNKHKGHQ